MSDMSEGERGITETPLASGAHLDRLSTPALLRVINAQDQGVARAVRKALPAIAKAVDRVVEAFKSGGRLLYVGAGTSGRLGVLDASECPPTFGTSPALVQGVIAGGFRALTRSIEGAEDDAAAGAKALGRRQVGPRDVVVGLSASGRTPFAIGALQYARRRGAATVAVTCNPGTALAAVADIAIEVIVGPEVVAGSTRLKAGTAQKLVLNMITTGAMVRWGRTFGHLMASLRPVSAKLKDRSVRIVAEAAGLSPRQAAATLKKAGGEAAVAVVMALGGTTAARARKILRVHQGSVRRALAALPSV